MGRRVVRKCTSCVYIRSLVFRLIDSFPRPSEVALSSSMGWRWRNMAHHGTPNGDGASGVVWPAYTLAKDQTMVFDDSASVKDRVKRGQCDMFDSLNQCTSLERKLKMCNDDDGGGIVVVHGRRSLRTR